MVWCVSYSSLETIDWSLYKFGGEGVNRRDTIKFEVQNAVSTAVKFI